MRVLASWKELQDFSTRQVDGAAAQSQDARCNLRLPLCQRAMVGLQNNLSSNPLRSFN